MGAARRHHHHRFHRPRRTGRPLPGREDSWSVITSYRVELAKEARDWPPPPRCSRQGSRGTGTRFPRRVGVADDSLTPHQQLQIRNLAAALSDLGLFSLAQGAPSCLPYYQEALTLSQRIGDRAAEALVAFNLGNAFLDVPGLRDLDQAEHWYRHSLSLREDSDRLVGPGSSAHSAE